MRKQVAVALLLILGLAIPHVVSAYSTPGGSMQKPDLTIPQSVVLQQNESCLAQTAIVIDGDNPFASATLAEKLENYHTNGVLNAAKNRYELCFDIQNKHVSMPSTLVVQPNPAADQSKGLAIYGLDVEPSAEPGQVLSVGDPVVEVSFSIAPVELNDLSINLLTALPMPHIVKGLLVEGTQLDITNSTFTGTGTGQEGDTCIELNGVNNLVIQDSSIRDCYVGVHVLNSTNTRIGGLTDLTGKNDITNNAKGILVEGSTAYKHGYNLIHSNDLLDDDYLYAVEIDGYPAPDPALFEVITERVGDKIYALNCKDDPENPKMVFSRTGGVVQLYIAGLEAKQASKYFMTCDLSGGDEHVFSNLPAGYEYDAEDCAIVDQNSNIIIVTGFHTSDHSSELMPPVKLVGEPPVIFAESGGVDVPTAPADVESGEEVSVTSAADGGITTVKTAGPCGASLLPNDVETTIISPFLGGWWIIFSIAFLASMRVAKVRRRRLARIHRNKRG